MAYSSLKDTQKTIQYTNKDYNSIKSKLLEFAQIYYPNTFNDFSEASPGMMFIEMAAYVGDVLSFYQDTQVQELFLTYAQEKENLYNLAYSLGYQPKITSPSNVNLDIFQLVPSININGDYKPDLSYALTIKENSSFIANSTLTNFLTQKTIDFSSSGSNDPTVITTYQINTSNNQPEYYLLKKSVPAISGEIKSETFSIGSLEKFLTIELQDTDIIEILSIKDADGNEWFEVPYLAQDTLFEDVKNSALNDPELHQYNVSTPYLLKLKKVPKRFVTRATSNGTLRIQFGAGISDNPDEEIIPNPDNVGLFTPSGLSKMDKAFDPSNILYTKAYGEPPSNTTLTVNYIKGGGIQTNVPSNSITSPNDLRISFKTGLSNTLRDFIIGSVTSNNPNAATGGNDGDSIEDVRQKAIASFSTQQRTVTKEDYMVRTLSMPARFGSVAKAYIVQEDMISATNKIKSNPFGLDLYVLGYNSNKHLTVLNDATKNNLSTYLEQFRMLTDSITIKDAYFVNFKIEFEIVTLKTYNNEEVVLNCVSELKKYFDIDKWQVNQPIIISEIRNILSNTDGVQNVANLIFTNITGQNLGYSQYKYDFKGATKNDIIYPSMDPCIFELRYPNQNIQGKTIQY